MTSIIAPKGVQEKTPRRLSASYSIKGGLCADSGPIEPP